MSFFNIYFYKSLKKIEKELDEKSKYVKDIKEFNTKGVKCQISQVNTACIDDVMKNKQDIENAINNFIEENKIDLYVFMITDIIKNDSQIIVLGQKSDIAEKAFDIRLDNNTAFLPGVVSRKKQVVPVIDRSI